jgi:hypothetical protein
MGLQALQLYGNCGRNAEPFNVKAGGTSGYHSALSTAIHTSKVTIRCSTLGRDTGYPGAL